jgi:hypothetical protein
MYFFSIEKVRHQKNYSLNSKPSMKIWCFKGLFTVTFLLSMAIANAQTISNVAPSIGMEGTTINVAISGQNSNFLQGTTTVWFNQGSSTIYANNVNVSSPSQLIAEVGIPYGTPLGLYQTNVQDPIDNTISLGNSFTVVANPNAPEIISVNPASTMEGTALTVSISGQNTNFQQGTTTVWFNQGSSTIYASNVNVNSFTSLDAFFNIPFGTPLGLYDTNVQDPVDNTVTATNSFTINANPNAPDLVSVTPNNGDLNTTIPVTISGQNTNFLQGTGTLIFIQGSSTLITSNLLFNTNTDLGATLTIPANAYPGYYDVYFTDPLDGTMLLLSGFYVNPPPCGNIEVDIVQQPCPGGPAFINVTGGYPPYQMIIDGQTIPIGNNYLDYIPPAYGNYQITSLVDNFGCQATSIDSTIHNEEFSATLEGANACIGESISLTNTVTSGYPISNIYFNFGNGSISSGNTISYISPGYYYPSMQVTNTNGCSIIVNATSPVFIYQPPHDSIISLTNANCGLTNGAFEIIGIGSGPFTYNVSGVGGYTSNSTLNNGLSAGLYTINITDSNGCSSSSMLSVANISNLTNISGNIQTSNGDNASNTTVILYDVNDTIGAMDISYSTLADANGNYSFANLAEGNYILAAQPDTSLFPDALVTYSNGAAAWFNSDTIQVSCTSQAVVDITLWEAVQQVGTAQIGGFTSEYTFNMLNDIALVLIDENTSEPVARISSDAFGNYNISNVNAGYYSIYADIPGLIHNTSYTFNIAPGDIFWNKSYFVNYYNRTIDTVFFFVGLNEIKSFESSVFPNPFNSQTTLNYSLPSTSFVNIEVYNYLGAKVETLLNEMKVAGKHNTIFSTANLSKGIYFIRITVADQQKTIKVISVD